jgi:hypothetical protein
MCLSNLEGIKNTCKCYTLIWKEAPISSSNLLLESSYEGSSSSQQLS